MNLGLPKPVFSPDNPYWQPSPYKRLTGQDFAYAWTWEMNSFCPGILDYVIRFVRGPVWKLMWVSNLRPQIRDNARKLLQSQD